MSRIPATKAGTLSAASCLLTSSLLCGGCVCVCAYQVCVFISGHAWGWGPMPWLVCSEVQPLHNRAAGTALATQVNFLLTFVIGQCFLSMLCSMRYGVFFFFAGALVCVAGRASGQAGRRAGAPAEGREVQPVGGRGCASVVCCLPSKQA